MMVVAMTTDAGGGGVCCVGEADAGVPAPGTLQAYHGRAGPLYVPARVHDTGTKSCLHLVVPCPQSNNSQSYRSQKLSELNVLDVLM